MNPYEADPTKIPPQDRYADVPLYGRYHPQPDDFRPEPQHIQSYTESSLQYWSAVIEKCTPKIRIYENTDGGRDVFALGTAIVKSSHLNAQLEGRRSCRDYSLADENEVAATRLARRALTDVKVPDIYFAGKINGRDVLVQERMAGVGLNIAWQYISKHQKQSFKDQARQVLRQLSQFKPEPASSHSYVVPDLDPVSHRGIQQLEHDILFSQDNNDSDLCLMHNDFTLSNCIVNDGRIVALVDWEMAGFFGWKTAGEIHVKIRTPKRENFAKLNLPEERLQDILFWNDLYDIEVLDQEVEEP